MEYTGIKQKQLAPCNRCWRSRNLSLAGIGFSGVGIATSIQRIQADPNNKCAWWDLGLSIFWLAASGYALGKVLNNVALPGGGGMPSGVRRSFVSGSWKSEPNSIAVKFGYTQNLRKYIKKIPGASYLDEESWFRNGLISSDALESNSWQRLQWISRWKAIRDIP